ncbi:O-antigen ligase family protein [Pseudomonas sp. M2]|uniref:O-antigen ligase family protein n=1 Tax=Pseudomonas sp. M2 TaxID=228756 RepID=UPI0018CA7E7E|nr:O-antigen ligase family protein [Pseudomonas sp. M2]MBG6124161.1 hypothetical protein [Pseudomonas sp. M2]HDS1748006.1 O-antigen ligase family protein [Pseudomonas putida]
MQMRFAQPISEGRFSKAGYLFAVMVLFVPTSSFYGYYAALLFGLFLLVWSSGGSVPWKVEVFYIYVSLVTFLLLLCLYRWIAYENSEDLKEYLKIALFCSVAFFGVRLGRNGLDGIFSIFVLVNCAVSLLQYLGVYEFGVREITDLYNAKHHVEASLSYTAPRALGLSPGPGQQSVICLFFFSYFLVQFFFGGGGLKRLMMCLVSLLGMVLSQSKTALIAIAIGSVVVFFLFVAHAGYKSKLGVLLLFVLVVGGVVAFKDQLLVLFPEYFRLAEQGGDVSSLQSRVGNWQQMLHVFFVEDSVFLYLFGVGRSGLEFYGVNDLPYDSDYVYVLVNYGLVGFFVFVAMLSSVLMRGVAFFSTESIDGKCLIIILVYAVVAAVALNYFFEPRILMIFAILIFNCAARNRVMPAQYLRRL